MLPMSDDQLARALLGALALMTALLLEAGDRLRDDAGDDDRRLKDTREVVRVAPDIAVIEESDEERRE
ncbi:hypothetical protein CWS96_gp22 [Saline Natrinema sp. J7-1 virus 1]|uniref:Uncharacterized protein n=1 Tax=Saline Natrinema sp. J7-1 virus 1 TaxID=2847285 RepID=A0AAE9VL62_9VIRU|nr:hypothetical protein CWS96_gp22 [Saline Natrinema sp. J7-1 virus 1]WBE14026.1 hypothetical protein [Saline Natrinema sp. J7-1 virus 1]